MTSKFKILLSIGLIAIIAVALGVSKWSSKNATGGDQAQNAPREETAKPTDNVDDLFASIDASVAAEDADATSDTDQVPSDEARDFDQSVTTTNEI